MPALGLRRLEENGTAGTRSELNTQSVVSLSEDLRPSPIHGQNKIQELRLVS